jgi:type III secretion protein V
VVQFALQPHEAEKIAQNISNSINKHSPTALVTSVQIRRHVRKLIEGVCFDTPVLSHNELMPHVRINVLESVGLPDMLLEAV